MGHILVAEDQAEVRRLAVRTLTRAGHEVEETARGDEALRLIQQKPFDLVLTDVRLPGSDGVQILQAVMALPAQTLVILMTGYGTVDAAIAAIRNGAADYLQKPFEMEELRLRVARAFELRQLTHERDYLRHTQPHVYRFDGIIGANGGLAPAIALVRKVAPSPSTVLIRGESGTGKELIAAAIHHNSPRARRAFVRVNCAALQENLLESELFGHERGAFTGADRQRIGRFEQADGGTLFLDEIGDMSSSTQAKVLRAIQQGEFERLGGTRTVRVNVRLLAATHRDLRAMIQAGTFREDLYYRLNVITIEVPPLRERKEDLPALIDFFLRKFPGEFDKPIDGLDPAARKILMRHQWPGNVRELQNVIERAVLLAEGRTLSADDLDLDRAGAVSKPAPLVNIPREGISLDEIERQSLVQALKMCNGVQDEAAALLSISPRVMDYKIKMHGIRVPGAAADADPDDQRPETSRDGEKTV
jgi:DNA-binding NtrC family response regulator